MRKLLNILYVTTPSSYLTKDGENLLVRSDEKEDFRIPIHNLEGVVTFGYAGASPGAMQLCAEKSVSLTFLSEHGRFMARVQGRQTGNVLLRRSQYRMADGALGIDIARRMIFGKIANCRAVLHRGLRDHAENLNNTSLSYELDDMQRELRRILNASQLDEIRGIEGDSAKRYFRHMSELVLVDSEAFHMARRSRRPPRDRMNALLSFMYTLLVSEVESALEAVGLDPYVGFLHRDRPGRPSLALDLMEELRPYLADRLVLSIVNRRQITEKDFVVKESGAVLLKPESRKHVISAWHARKQEQITHPILREKMKIGLLPYVQAQLLTRHIRGDLETYTPFLWKRVMDHDGADNV